MPAKFKLPFVLENIKFHLAKNKYEYGLFVLAALIRVGFLYFGTSFYFGKPGVQVLGDTWWWISSLENLLEHGVYTINPTLTDGFFSRPPGYAFFLMPFYLIFGDWHTAFPFVVGTQILMDAVATVLVFKIAKQISGTVTAGLLSGLLYAGYVFSFGWTAVTYPDSASLFFLILGLWLFTGLLTEKFEDKKYWIFAGACFGIAALMRIQLILLIPLIPLVYLAYRKWRLSAVFKNMLYFSIGIVFTYGLWPLRNIVLQGEWVFTQRLEDAGHWASDFMTFREFVWSVKTDIEPEFTLLMSGQQIHWPEGAKLTPHELELAKEAIHLMDSCGTGLRTWRNSNGYADRVRYWDTNCNKEIAEIWSELIDKQKKNNTLHHYLTVPFGNLHKAYFKTEFVNIETPVSVRAVFSGRSVLLVLGWIATIMLSYRLRGPQRWILLMIASAVLVEYIFMSFFFRSMEMRYLMQVDALFLIPVGIMSSRFRIIFPKR